MPYYVPDLKLEPEEDTPITYCDECGEGIYEDEEYFYIDGDNVCDECLRDYFGYCVRTAQREEM